MRADDSGNIWSFVNSYIYRYDLPDDFNSEDKSSQSEDWEKNDYFEDLGRSFKLIKLDNTGTEILSIDLSEIIDGNVNINSIEIDNKGNIFAHVTDFSGLSFAQTFGSSDIYVLSEDGAVQFILNAPELIDLSMIKMPDGTVAVTGFTENTPVKRMLTAIDISAKSWKASVELPLEAKDVFPGNEEYDLLFNDQSNLYGYSLNTKEQTKILGWVDSNILNRNMKDIRLLPDGRILCVEQEFNYSTFRHSFKIIVLTKTARADMPERIVLTLAGIYIDQDIEKAVVEFNMSNYRYAIEIVDYGEFNSEDDWEAGRIRLTTEIISGRVPDIILLSQLPFRQFVSKGLFEDLYPYIDSDHEFDRSSFVENAFRTSEINGGLYQVFPSFTIQTIVGNPLILSPEPGWTLEEFMNVLAENPEAIRPFGPVGIYEWYWLIQANLNEYIDWSTGTAYFDRGDFAELLEWLYHITSYGETSASKAQMVTSGEQIMDLPLFYSGFSGVQVYKTVFGGDMVFKGFPTANRSGNYMVTNLGLAITTKCKDKEGAWEFVRMILTEQWQENLNRGWGFPTNKAVFDGVVWDAMNPNPDHIYGAGWGGNEDDDGFSIRLRAVTQDEVDQVMALINSMTSALFNDSDLWFIIREGVDDFFNGRNTAQDTARIIQNRVSIYLAEQN